MQRVTRVFVCWAREPAPGPGRGPAPGPGPGANFRPSSIQGHPDPMSGRYRVDIRTADMSSPLIGGACVHSLDRSVVSTSTRDRPDIGLVVAGRSGIDPCRARLSGFHEPEEGRSRQGVLDGQLARRSNYRRLTEAGHRGDLVLVAMPHLEAWACHMRMSMISAFHS